MSVTDLEARAKLAEAAERYEDMTKAVRSMAQLGSALSTEQRNLLSVAYKNVVGARRASWRVLTGMLEARKDDASASKTITEYRGTVERELEDWCKELLDLVEEHLLKNDNSTNGRVFYNKMAADYYRYLCEIRSGSDRSEAMQKGCENYERAMKTAESELPPTDPVRLGLALNFSVFYYEIQNDQKRAMSMAKQAFDDAISELDGLPEEEYKDATLIMQLIRDNLTLWADTAGEPEQPVDNDGTAVEDM